MESSPDPQALPPKAPRSSGLTRPFLVLAAVAAIAAGSWFLVNRLLDDSKLQDCVMAGHGNCDPVSEGGR